jgi:peptide deformylase
VTDEQKKKKPGREIGGIQAQQWNHFGSEEEDTQPSEKPDSQIASNVDNKMVHYPESRHVGLSASQIAESQDKQMISYLREKKPERKAQIAYLPPELIKKLKRFAFDHDQEISQVVQVAVSEYLERQKDRQP